MHLAVYSVPGSVQCTWHCTVYLAVYSIPGSVQCTWHCTVYLAVNSIPGRWGRDLATTRAEVEEIQVGTVGNS